MSALLIGGALAVTAVAAWYLWPVSANATACPTVGSLGALLAEIRAGTVTKTDATNIAGSYDGLGCADAAAAVRLAMAGAVATAIPPTKFAGPSTNTATNLGFSGFDVFGVANLTAPLPANVQALLDRAPVDWTDWDRTVRAPALQAAVLQDFTDRGLFKPGKTSLARVTAYNAIGDRAHLADLARGDAAPGTVDFGSSGDYTGSTPVDDAYTPHTAHRSV